MTAASPVPDRLRILTAQQDGWSVTTVTGELDAFTVPALDTQLLSVIGAQPAAQYAIDLAGVTFCDSAGLSAFIRAWKRALGMGSRLILLRPSRRLHDLLKMTGIDQAIETYDSLPPAITLEAEESPKTPPPEDAAPGKRDPVA